YVLLDAKSYGEGKIIVGARTELHDFCRLQCYGGSIESGEDCLIKPLSLVYRHRRLTICPKDPHAAHFIIIPRNHWFANPGVPIMHQPESRRGIVIEPDVWIGAHAVILDGVTVGHGSVVAAGAVVNRDVPSMTLVAGVPARPVRRRVADDQVAQANA